MLSELLAELPEAQREAVLLKEEAGLSLEEIAQATGRAKAMPAPAPSLGTGHGARESSWVTHTAFERRSSSPDEVIVLRYDSRENLVARGVLPAWEPQPRRPLPFPDAPATGYVPDPPH